MSAPAETVRLERVFSASPEEVFDAWTNPAVLERWWGPRPTWDSPGCDVDLRVGGSYLLRMRNPDSGTILEVGGEYRVIERPRRLVYTWAWLGDSMPGAGQESLVTVEFQGEGATTRVVLEHAGLPTEESRTAHREGWEGCLSNLRGRMFGD
ncbi:MAG TPA: SRPBCC domain-containing protein [Solirubrobacteraceae bacterium]|jgi:uncharacterized protein YndB with AHSA1/START domain